MIKKSPILLPIGLLANNKRLEFVYDSFKITN